MKHLKYLIPFVLIALITSSCHKDPPKTYDDTDMTMTTYNTEFKFQDYTTFVVPDSTLLKTNYLTDAQVASIYAEGGTSDQTLDLITQSFLGLGYTQVDSLSQADFIAVPTLLMIQSDETVYYSPGWWWGYPGYGWGWGWYKSTNYYYWWYPPYYWYPPTVPVTVSTYTGTLVFEMLDAESYRKVLDWENTHPDPPEPEDNAPTYEINWQAQVQGYSTDDGSYNKERAERGVQEALEQSPYLVK